MWWVAAALAMPLERAVEAALADRALSGGSVSVVIGGYVDLDGDRRLVPASTVKFLTAAAVLERHALDEVLETRVGYTGAVTDHVLVGDVVVTGAGDPGLGVTGPGGVAARIAAMLAEAGITRVDGDVVADAAVFDGPELGRGWMWDDLPSDWSAPFSGLSLGHNLATEVTAEAGCTAAGGVGSPVDDPAGCAALVFRRAIVDGGIPVSGAARVHRAPDAPLPAVTPLSVIGSETLREELRHMLGVSDNLYAESLWRLADPAVPHTANGARDAVAGVLAAAGSRDRAPVDGSGLSRYTLLSARTLAQVAEWSRTRPWGRELEALLPVAGKSGTLGDRARATPAEGRVRAKTGSMNGVRNLVGYADDAGGASLAFAILMNGFLCDQADAIAVQDRVLALIAVSRDGKVRASDVRKWVPE